ncbi:MAG: hypothetical protein Q7I94_01890, partial [Candidatus Contubernalis sp.]|nr:hypothetical protein [Candidatus Contubernalis sp.]
PMSVFWIVLSIHDFENVFEIRSLFSPEIMGPYGLLLILIPYSLLWSGYLIHKIAGKNSQDAREGER